MLRVVRNLDGFLDNTEGAFVSQGTSDTVLLASFK